MAIKENAVEAMKSTMTEESINHAQLLANRKRQNPPIW